MAAVGVSLESATTVIGISPRTIQRWRGQDCGECCRARWMMESRSS
jgi:hypothetical protein